MKNKIIMRIKKKINNLIASGNNSHTTGFLLHRFLL